MDSKLAKKKKKTSRDLSFLRWKSLAMNPGYCRILLSCPSGAITEIRDTKRNMNTRYRTLAII